MSKIAPTLEWLANGGGVEGPFTYSKARAELRALLAVARAATYMTSTWDEDGVSPVDGPDRLVRALARLSRAGRGRGK